MGLAYSFGEYVLDAQNRTLRRDKHQIDIGARAYGVLQLLVENAGRVVSKEELLDGVWGDVVVTEYSLTRAISDLRTALGDDTARPRFIRTVHRQGYVLVAPVVPLEEVAVPAATEAGASRKPLRNWLILAAVAVLALALVWAVPRFIKTTEVGDDASRQDFANWKLRVLGPSPFTSTAIKPAFAKSHDLLSVVAPDPDTGTHSVFLFRPEGGEPLQLTRGIEVRGPSPEFTPDDSHIIFTTYRYDANSGLVPDVWLVPVPAGEPTLLVEHASAASFSPDGSALAYSAVTSNGTSIRVRHEDGRELDVAERGFWPRWSPDGKWIAYTTSDPEGTDGILYVVRPDDSERRQLTKVRAQMYGLCWSPDGSRVIFNSGQAGPGSIWSVDVNSGEQVAVTWGPGISSAPTISRDGRRVVFDFDSRRWYLYLAPEADGPLRRVLIEPGVVSVALSPDGGSIALALGAAGQSPAVIVVDVRTMKRRTLSGMTASEVAWMPDGESLLVAAVAPDEVSNWIWRVPIGGGLPQPILKGEANWGEPSASPDGSMVAAVSRAPSGSQLVVRDLERETDRIVVEKASVAAPRWSPDGRLLSWSGAWRPDDLDSGGVWVWRVGDASPRRLTPDGVWPAWDTGGEHLLFVRFLENEGIWRVPVAGGPASLVRRLEGELRELSLEGLDTGRNGTPVLVFLSQFTGELYALEAPER